MLTRSTLDTVLHEEDALRAIGAYSGIRLALTNPDHMGRSALLALADRVMTAAKRYPDGPDTFATTAANRVLRAYAAYLAAVIIEGEDD